MPITPKTALAAVGLLLVALATSVPADALRAQDNDGMGSGMSHETTGSHQQMMGTDADNGSDMMGSEMGHDGGQGMSGSGNGHMMDGASGEHSMMGSDHDGMMGSDGHHGMMGH